MKFQEYDLTRKTGKEVFYVLVTNGKLIVDYGDEDGNFSVFNYEATYPASKLKAVLGDSLGEQDVESDRNLLIIESGKRIKKTVLRLNQ